VVSKVELPEVAVETIAEVEMADEDPPAPAAPPAPPVAVEVSVLDGTVVVETPEAEPELAPTEDAVTPASAQYLKP